MHAPTLAAATPRNFSIAGLPIPVQDNAAQVLLETAAACKQQYTHSRHNCDAVCPLNSECSQASGAVLACCNPANVQPCMTAYCICHNTYDPGISPGSASQCILGDVYLRSNLSRNPADHGHTTESLAALVWCCCLRLQVTWPIIYIYLPYGLFSLGP